MFSFLCRRWMDSRVLCKVLNIIIKINASIYEAVRAPALTSWCVMFLGPALLVSWREITYLSHFPAWLSSQAHLQPEFHRKLSSPKRAKEDMKLCKC